MIPAGISTKCSPRNVILRFAERKLEHRVDVPAFFRKIQMPVTKVLFHLEDENDFVCHFQTLSINFAGAS